MASDLPEAGVPDYGSGGPGRRGVPGRSPRRPVRQDVALARHPTAR